MALLDIRTGIVMKRWLFCSVFMIITIGLPPGVTGADDNIKSFQDIMRESLETMWVGGETDPGLLQRQQFLKTMLATGAVNEVQLEGMLETMFLSLLERHKTSRYAVVNFPDRFNDLLLPHLDWKTIKAVLWRALSSVITKDDPVLYKVGTLAPPGTPWLSVPETIAFPEIEKLSERKIQIKIYGGGVMGDDEEILDKMDAGQLDACGCTALGVLASCPEASALLLPGLFNNYDEVDYIFEKFRKQLDEGFEKNGYTLWALFDTGFFYLFSKYKTPGLADIAKQEAMTWFGIIEAPLYEELGINATPVPVPDVVASLNTGKTDLNLAPPAWVLGMQAYQFMNYYIIPPLVYSPGVVVSKASTIGRIQQQLGISAVFAYNIQEIVIAEIIALEKGWRRQIRIFEEKSLKAFETRCGMKAITLPPEDLKKLEAAGKAVQQKLSGKVFPADLVRDMTKALEEYRKTHP